MIDLSHETRFALTIAGSDSGGGAGVQADLRAFASQGVFGLTAITAVTAQNTRLVSDVRVLPVRVVAAQCEAVFDDFEVAAVKTGMLANVAISRQIARLARQKRHLPWVIDPVMIASSGARLLDDRAEQVLRTELLPQATLLTPNLPEAEVLLGRAIRSHAELVAAARDLAAIGPRAVLLKGGHLPGPEVVDVLCVEGQVQEFRAARREIRSHGTGCTLASLIAARLALGEELLTAVSNGIGAFRRALESGVVIGQAQVWVPYTQQKNSPAAP